MPKPKYETVDVWSVEGRFQQLIFSPKGAIEGVLIETDGIPTQFVTDPHVSTVAGLFGSIRNGQTLVIEGVEAGPSSKGEPAHSVYIFERLVSVDGKDTDRPPAEKKVSGTVVRLNFAKHGAANGVVLDIRDFVHTRPDGMERLRLKVGDKVVAEGSARPLVTGAGHVIEARKVNGEPLVPPGH